MGESGGEEKDLVWPDTPEFHFPPANDSDLTVLDVHRPDELTDWRVSRGSFEYVDGLGFEPREWKAPEEFYDGLVDDEAIACLTALALHLQALEQNESKQS